MRESIFEKYRKSELDCNAEFRKIRDLISEYESSFNEQYRNSKVSFLGSDIFEAFKTIIGTNVNCVLFNPDPLDSIDISLDTFLDILEFLKNAFYCKNKTVYSYQMSNIIDMCVLKSGHAFTTDEESRAVLYLINPTAEAVATMVEKSVATKIYDYLIIRTGDIESKRMALKSLADDIEVICKKTKDDNEFKKVSQIMQCIRHPKDKMQPKYPFFFENEEKWMDKLFEMFIYVLSGSKAKELIKEFISLETINS